MAAPLHPVRFPGESPEYRAARDTLLRAEVALRERLADVAALRRQLPQGGPLKADYRFESADTAGTSVRLSELFAPGKSSLIVYSFMFGPDADAPCPMCTSFLDGADAAVPHITQRLNFAVVAKSPAERLRNWKERRGWKNLRLLSSTHNTYNADYFAETPDGRQIPACNVFVSTDDGIRHFYATELLYVSLDGHPRHVDLLWPIWSFFDLTPEGRGTDWNPKLAYD